jgi:hypothetical protein
MGKRGGGMYKTKKTNLASKEEQAELQNLFEQMTGSSNAEPDVIIPKILNLKRNLVRYIKTLDIFINFNFSCDKNDVEIDVWQKEFKDFIDTLLNSVNIDIKKKYDEHNINQILELQNLSEEEINESYKKLKENKDIKKIIISCSELSNYKVHIEDKNKLNGNFIKREPGLTLKPLNFSELDLKLLWNYINEKEKKIVLSIIHYMYDIGYEIYDIISSPDIDIKKFSSILVNAISNLRKQIPRCDKAFDIIENSVGLLEKKFKGYYKSSVIAENPSIIMENFVIDVSTTQKTSPLINSQFKKIANYLRSKNQNTNNPKLKSLFGLLDSNLEKLN